MTLTVQEVFAARVAPVVWPKFSVPLPAVGAQVGEPLQVVAADGVAATTTPEGRLSVNLTPDSDEERLGLLMVNVSVLVVPVPIVVGENALVIVGGLGGEAGTAQPRMTISSSSSVGSLDAELCAPVPMTRKLVELAPVLAALTVASSSVPPRLALLAVVSRNCWV